MDLGVNSSLTTFQHLSCAIRKNEKKRDTERVNTEGGVERKNRKNRGENIIKE